MKSKWERPFEITPEMIDAGLAVMQEGTVDNLAVEAVADQRELLMRVYAAMKSVELKDTAGLQVTPEMARSLSEVYWIFKYRGEFGVENDDEMAQELNELLRAMFSLGRG